MSKLNDSNKLAIQMLIAMVSGILAGLLFMAGREYFGPDSTVWTTVNNLLFQDITAPAPSVRLAYSILVASFLSVRFSSLLSPWFSVPL